MRRPGTHAALAGLVAAGLAVWAGCNQIAGIQEGALADGSVAGDVVTVETGPDATHDGGSTTDGTTSNDSGDGGAGESSVTDGPVQDVQPDVPTVYNDMGNPTFWSVFDTSTVDGGGCEACEGAAFDGRYIYMPSTDGNLIVRYDTQGSFVSPASWANYNQGGTGGYYGAVYDGTRYVYFVNATVARYDTQGGFDTSTSWTSYVTGATTLTGATFDGQYIYFSANSPYRYDTTAPFGVATSWATFSIASLTGLSDTYGGAVFDGRYVYFAPSSGNVARYDTQSNNFTELASWTAFQTDVLGASASDYYGAALDGRYVYFTPYATLGSGQPPNGLVTRYDTMAGFGVASSWSIFDTTTLNANDGTFTAAGFDGRFLYYLQDYNGGSPSIVTRYDTTGPFDPTGSLDGGPWSSISTAVFNPLAWDFHGAVFDGRYMYLVPNFNAIVARFDTKTPPSMPNLPDFHGSFY